jgi:membrane associated rhomboid family serine protease
MLDSPGRKMPSRPRPLIAALASRPPVITCLLLFANFAVFGLGLYLAVRNGVPPQQFLQRSDDPRALVILHQLGALTGADLEAGQWWRLLALCFVHIGAMHLFMNMLALYVLGCIEEPLWGRWRFLAIYLLSGLAGSCAMVSVRPQALGAGASGAVWGLLTALVVWVIAYRGRTGRGRRLRLPVILLVVALETATSFLPGISAAAHFGGGAMGLIASFLLLGQRLSRPVLRWLCVAALAALPVGCAAALIGIQALALHRARLAVTRDAEDAMHLEEKVDNWTRTVDPTAAGPEPLRELSALVREAREGFEQARERMSQAWEFRFPQAQRIGEKLLIDSWQRTSSEEWIAVAAALDHEAPVWRSLRLTMPILFLPPDARDRETAEDLAQTLKDDEQRLEGCLSLFQAIGPCLDPQAEKARELGEEHVEAVTRLWKSAAVCLTQKENWSKQNQFELERRSQEFRQLRYLVRRQAEEARPNKKNLLQRVLAAAILHDWGSVSPPRGKTFMPFSKRRSLAWLFGGLLLLWPLVVATAGMVPWSRLAAFLSTYWEEQGPLLAPLLVLALAPYAILLLGALSGVNFRPATTSRGELDRLITRKRQGALLNRSRGIRESAARTSRYVSSLSRSSPTDPVPLMPGQVLDRLLQLRREWRLGSSDQQPALEQDVVPR